MPQINVKSFNQIVESLEKMADGASKHSREQDFPQAIKEVDIRKDKKKIENLREAYEDAEGRARRSYDAYKEEENKSKKEFSRYKSMIYVYVNSISHHYFS